MKNEVKKIKFILQLLEKKADKDIVVKDVKGGRTPEEIAAGIESVKHMTKTSTGENFLSEKSGTTNKKRMPENKSNKKELLETSMSIGSPLSFMRFEDDDVVNEIQRVFEQSDYSEFVLEKIQENNPMYNIVVSYTNKNPVEGTDYETKNSDVVQKIYKLRNKLFADISTEIPVVNATIASIRKSKPTTSNTICFEIVLLVSNTNNRDWVTGKAKSIVKERVSKKKINEDVSLKDFKDKFTKDYSYIAHNISDKEIQKFLDRKDNKGKSLNYLTDQFEDYILSQGLQDDIQESVKRKFLKESTSLYSMFEELQSFLSVPKEIIEKARNSNINTFNNSSLKNEVKKWSKGVYDNDPDVLFNRLVEILKSKKLKEATDWKETLELNVEDAFEAANDLQGIAGIKSVNVVTAKKIRVHFDKRKISPEKIKEKAKLPSNLSEAVNPLQQRQIQTAIKNKEYEIEKLKRELNMTIPINGITLSYRGRTKNQLENKIYSLQQELKNLRDKL